jgi:7,8-dihydropterin-6-yl-methyl-4-(beta-D-ribofuranosyl)aminobenzene 5'-phosphate synthase
MSPGNTKLTILVDDTPGPNGLAGEHGFCVWVERGSTCILFDTGQTDLALNHAGALGVDLHRAESIVLSHGHYDHTGGLRSLFDAGIGINLYAHPEAFCPKYVRDKDGRARFIGMPITIHEVRKHISIIWTHRPTEIGEGIYATGPVPRTTSYEDTGGHFFVDETCQRPDPLPDDQSLFWESRNGMVVLLGCAHAGVVNTLNYVCGWTGQKTIHAVIGGMHLLAAPASRREATAAAFRELGVQILGPLHCTGTETVKFFQNQLPGQFQSFRTGSSILFE